MIQDAVGEISRVVILMMLLIATHRPGVSLDLLQNTVLLPSILSISTIFIIVFFVERKNDNRKD